MKSSPFINEVRAKLRFKQMAYATEKSYLYWIRFFIRFHKYQSPSKMKSEDVTVFLTYLAVTRHVSPNTQNQAFNALLFLFRHILNLPFDNIQAIRAKEQIRYIPTSLSAAETVLLIQRIIFKK